MKAVMILAFAACVAGIDLPVLPPILPPLMDLVSYPIPVSKVSVNSSLLWKLAAMTSTVDVLGNYLMYDTGNHNQIQAYTLVGNMFCEGFDSMNGVNFFHTFSTLMTGEGHDFGGNELCGHDCNGQCIPYRNQSSVGPPTLYPFACKCAAGGCDANGPKRDHFPWYIAGTDVQCVQDDACKCNDMTDACGNTVGGTGWLCNWITVDNTYINVDIPPQFSLIKWCDCCQD